MGRPGEVRLYYSPASLEPTEQDLIMLRAVGIPVEQMEAEQAQTRHLLSYARELGITVKGGFPDEQAPNDYVLDGPAPTAEEERVIVRAASPNSNLPKTYDFGEYDAEPFFPVVAKALISTGGQHKYLIETEEQWRRLRRVLTNDGPWIDDPEPRQANPYPAEQIFTEMMYFQQYIRTPVTNTSYRVLSSAVGDVIASSLLYASERRGETKVAHCKQTLDGLIAGPWSPFDFLRHPGTLVYLDSRDITSNLSQHGNSIVLDGFAASKPLKPEEAAILEAHGLDPEHPGLPDELREQSRSIARTLGRRTGILSGMDWLQDEASGSYVYLESNARPGVGAFADRFLGGLPENDLPAYRAAERALAEYALRSIAGWPHRAEI